MLQGMAYQDYQMKGRSPKAQLNAVKCSEILSCRRFLGGGGRKFENTTATLHLGFTQRWKILQLLRAPHACQTLKVNLHTDHNSATFHYTPTSKLLLITNVEKQGPEQ